MKPQPFSASKDSNPIPPDLMELISAIGNLPTEYQRKLEPVVTRVKESTRRRKRILNLVQEALSQLRLDMKYLMFDLEATRRERDAYKADLDQHGED